MNEAAESLRLVRFESFEVHLRSGELWRAGQRVRLPEQSFQILAMLLARPGQVVMRQQIRERLWPDDTVVEFENSINSAVKRLRLALGDSADSPRYIETLARRGYRWMVPVEWDLIGAAGQQVTGTPVRDPRSSPFDFYLWFGWRKPWLMILLPLAALLSWLVARPPFHTVSAKRLSGQDTIVLADFANSTGDPIFNDTLKQALRSALQQSPFLNILPDRRVSKALALMTHPSNTLLTPELALEVCRREQSKAYIAGAVASLGSDYVIGLKTVNCLSGEILSEQQVTTERKETVLNALSKAATKLREQLGESLVTVGKFDVPLDQTTPSLEALRQYNLGMKAGDSDSAGGLPYFLRAIQLDPDFAMAYLATAETYANLNQGARAVDYFTKSFQLRDHANVREKLEIESQYYGNVTGELDKAAQTYRKTIESYPQSPAPYGNLGMVYSQQGQYEKAAGLARQVLQVFPNFGGEAYQGIAEDVLPLQRLDEARQILRTAVDRKLDTDGIHKDLYGLGFLGGDVRVMAEQSDWLARRLEYANLAFTLESETEGYLGRLGKARELTGRAVEAGVRSDNKEAAALWRENAAIREALVGNRTQAHQDAVDALKIAPASTWKSRLR